jgi:D-alanyl-D-alanine dipeptidase
MKYLILFFYVSSTMASIHPDFISVLTLCPQIKVQANYGTADNFTGEIVRGYKAPKAYMAKKPDAALCKVQKDALEKGLTLKIFDGYRPVKAVTFFQEWAKRPETNPHLKAIYYPNYSRGELFERGYIALKSSHSRGSAVDLTLVDLKTGQDLDMGSSFDFFNDLSHTESTQINEGQRKNRYLLRELMESQGFKNFNQEWWHFSFKPEPFPEDYFDFNVE